MSDNQPREYDAVLGGGNPIPIYGAVLGGIEGVKRRLANPVADTRAIAITQAANYGKEGLDLIIEALNDTSGIVRGVAYEILQQKLKEPFMQGSKTRLRKELANFNILKIFTTLNDWVVQDFNPDIGIIDTEFIAYNVNSIEELKTLLHSPSVNKLHALTLTFNLDEVNNAIDILLNNYKCFSTLRALRITEIRENRNFPFTGEIEIGEILKFYPALNILQIQGGRNINFSPVQHTNLKTLSIATSGLNLINVQNIHSFEISTLEYLDLFSNYINNKVPDYLLSCTCFQNLKYLGLRTFRYYKSETLLHNRITSLIIRENIINNLIFLDLSDGDLTDKGAKSLLNCSAINNLYLLNVSNNFLSPEMVKRLSKLKCKVIADSQFYNQKSKIP